jgi:hypothetical protein
MVKVLPPLPALKVIFDGALAVAEHEVRDVDFKAVT